METKFIKQNSNNKIQMKFKQNPPEHSRARLNRPWAGISGFGLLQQPTLKIQYFMVAAHLNSRNDINSRH
jgi:hypothetical protein